MQQLWLSSPELALGSCIPNLGWFLASNNLAKTENLKKSSYGSRDHPLYMSHTIISVMIPFTVDIFFSHVRPFLDLLLNLRHFGHFETAST